MKTPHVLKSFFRVLWEAAGSEELSALFGFDDNKLPLVLNKKFTKGYVQLVHEAMLKRVLAAAGPMQSAE